MPKMATINTSFWEVCIYFPKKLREKQSYSLDPESGADLISIVYGLVNALHLFACRERDINEKVTMTK